MKTVHLIYPFDASRIAAPWSIGNNLTYAIKKAGFDVVNYDWDSEINISPREGDVLLGHPHPDNRKTFNRNFNKNFSKVISINPWNGLPDWEKTLSQIVPECTQSFFICADYWQQRTPSWFTGKCLDMAINPNHYPRVKFQFNEPGRRGFAFIGCCVESKNAGYLTEIKKAFPAFQCAHIGYGYVEGIENLQYWDFSNGQHLSIISRLFDFVIVPSRNDANPTVILEAMAWGLIPVCTPQSGWSEQDAVHIPIDDIDGAVKVIYDLSLQKKESDLNFLQNKFLARKKFYTWDRFCGPIIEELNK